METTTELVEDVDLEAFNFVDIIHLILFFITVAFGGKIFAFLGLPSYLGGIVLFLKLCSFYMFGFF
jgi:hypothetical protein